MVQSIGWAFAVSSFLNACWILAWHYELVPLSVLIMLGLLATLLYIGWVIHPLPLGWTKAAFGIYLGWICIATIANITALLVDINWSGWGITAEIWTIIMIAAGMILTTIALVRFQNPFVGLAVIWAFIGIVLKRAGDNTLIGTSALIAIGIMVVVTFWVFMYPTFYKSGVN